MKEQIIRALKKAKSCEGLRNVRNFADAAVQIGLISSKEVNSIFERHSSNGKTIELEQFMCERVMRSLLQQLLDAYHDYNPTGIYLYIKYEGGKLFCSNNGWGEDRRRPLQFLMEVPVK